MTNPAKIDVPALTIPTTRVSLKQQWCVVENILVPNDIAMNPCNQGSQVFLK